MYGLEKEINALLEGCKESDIYKEYQARREELLKHEGLKEQVDEFRTKNYEIQNQEDDGNLEERIMKLADSYLWLTEQPVVRSFLDAELALCRMLQEITNYFLVNVDFD